MQVEKGKEKFCIYGRSGPCEIKYFFYGNGDLFLQVFFNQLSN